MELFRLIRSRPSQSPDKSGVTARIVPNHSDLGKGKRKCESQRPCERLKKIRGVEISLDGMHSGRLAIG
jgi:hypothetical protein